MQETFRLTNHFLDAFALAVVEGRDSSIEAYLLNNWTKSLSLRDIVDRIQVSTKFSTVPPQTFQALFSWVFQNKLNDSENWVLDDFRKVALLLA